MDKASDFGSEDWGFESLRGRFFCCFLFITSFYWSHKVACLQKNIFLFFWEKSSYFSEVVMTKLWTETKPRTVYIQCTTSSLLFSQEISSLWFENQCLPNFGPACPLIFLNLTGSSIEYIKTKRIIELFLRTALEDAILTLVFGLGVQQGCAWLRKFSPSGTQASGVLLGVQ